MRTLVHVVAGPSLSDILSELLRQFREALREGIGSALWIVPHRRMALELRSRLCQPASPGTPGFRAMLQPRVVDFAGFAESIVREHEPNLSPLPPGQHRLLIDEVITELRAEGALSYYERIADSRGFAESIIGFLAELQALGIDPPSFEEACTASVDARDAKLLACRQLFARYLQQLEQRQRLDLPALLRKATAILKQKKNAKLPVASTLFLAGFNSFTPIETDFLRAVIGHVKAVRFGLLESDVARPELFAFLAQPGKKHAPPKMQPLTAPTLPIGLMHLRQNLFVVAAVPQGDATGIRLLEAPGKVGEARLVARSIRQQLDAGIAPETILVTMRKLGGNRDLLAEVFQEYAVPIDLEGSESLLRNPAVAALLRAARLPEEDWPFAEVTTLLRSNYFQPAWQECKANPGIAQRAESLLRLLEEVRGRKNYLEAARIWAETPPEGLEDEQAEEARRQRKIRLAQECRAFLERFFTAWDAMPLTATLAEFTRWLQSFAVEIGLEDASVGWPKDRSALQRLWEELTAWIPRQSAQRTLNRTTFLDLVSKLAAAAWQAQGTRQTGKVRILSAEIARCLPTETLYIMGLGEGSFPNLSPPDSLLDDADRLALQQVGLAFPDPAQRLDEEKRLFQELVALPRRELILSYPAVDEKGQPLLPSSFLTAAVDCFLPQAIPITAQRMLIEGYLKQEPLSAAELRVQWAALGTNTPPRAVLNDDLVANLRDAATLARARFQTAEFNEFDGLLNAPAIMSALGERFGNHKVISPTALEAYIACPFRFLMRNVLKLEPLEEPSEDIEQTRRGSVFHRALARFHVKIREETQAFLPGGTIPETVGEELRLQLDRAIQEYVDRAPSAPTKVLWQLEGKRLQRSAGRYPDHWKKFTTSWQARQMLPLPQLLEADFGMRPNATTPTEMYPALTIAADGIEIRLGGRIDRIDTAPIAEALGFWIIDYKTGSAKNYTGKALESMEKLQLSLYALAVEKVFFPGQNARPLGLAYWLVTDTGPKQVLPKEKETVRWLNDQVKWETFRAQLEAWVLTLVKQIRGGNFRLAPRSVDCTTLCDFSQVCRINQSRDKGLTAILPLPGDTEDEEEAP